MDCRAATGAALLGQWNAGREGFGGTMGDLAYALSFIRQQERRADALVDFETRVTPSQPDQGGNPMPTEQDVDLSCVDADIRTGMTLKRAAGKYGLPLSTLRSRLKKAGYATARPGGASDPDADTSAERSRQAPRHRPQKTATANGHSNGSGDLAALATLIETRWASMTIIEKVRRLLT